MKSLLEVLKLSTDYFSKKGLESPRKEAELLLSDLLGIKRMQLYLEFDRPIEDLELEKLRERLKRRASGEPSQYIHGHVEFYGIDVIVNSSVLIPRQETEILVDKISQCLALENLKGKTLLDLCSGSGCIGLSLKKRYHELDVILSDFSKEALQVAHQNAKKNTIDVTLLEGDLLKTLQNRKVDYIVCNPPYISDAEFENLSPEVKNFEPKEALLSGKTGLEFYERLSSELPLHLLPQGKVWLEIGASQGAAVLEIFSKPIWKKVLLEKDWSGHDRFISLEIE